MKIRCYNVTADRKVVNKQLPNAYTELTISNTDSIDMERPAFVVYYSNLPFTYNYLYCDSTGYYYYIDSVKVLTGGRIVIYCSIDIRKTLATFIKNDMACTVVRSEQGITAIHDNKLPVRPDECKKIWTTLNSPFTITPDSYRIVLGVFNSRS